MGGMGVPPYERDVVGQLDADEYTRRWFAARDALFPVAVRLTVLVVAVAAVLNYLAVRNPWVLVWWAFGLFAAAAAAVWVAVLYCGAKGDGAQRYKHIWRESYREPWRIVPRREPSE